MTGIKRFEDYEKELRKKYGKPNRPIFTVSGLAGVGTTTTAKIIEKEYDLDRFNAGDFFRKKIGKGMDIYKMMENLDKMASDDEDLDIECEKHLLELPFKKTKVLLESRVAGVLLKDMADIRIWVTCPQKIVVERISRREHKSEKKALEDIRKRNKIDMERYEEKYDINIKKREHYNIFINTSKGMRSVEEQILEKIARKIDKLNLEI